MKYRAFKTGTSIVIAIPAKDAREHKIKERELVNVTIEGR